MSDVDDSMFDEDLSGSQREVGEKVIDFDTDKVHSVPLESVEG